MEHTNREREERGLLERTNEEAERETICVTRIEGERMRTNERAGESATRRANCACRSLLELITHSTAEQHSSGHVSCIIHLNQRHFFCSTLYSARAQDGPKKWKDTKQQPGTAGSGNMLGCCLISFHFLWAILSTSTVQG